MADWGFRISKDGEDVKTCDDIDCIVTSKYANLKGVLAGLVIITKTQALQNFTIVAHNLGYIPFVQMYYYDTGNEFGRQLPFPIMQGFPWFSCYADDTNIYLRSMIAPNNDYTFKYFIFIDKASL